MSPLSHSFLSYTTSIALALISLGSVASLSDSSLFKRTSPVAAFRYATEPFGVESMVLYTLSISSSLVVVKIMFDEGISNIVSLYDEYTLPFAVTLIIFFVFVPSGFFTTLPSVTVYVPSLLTTAVAIFPSYSSFML